MSFGCRVWDQGLELFKVQCLRDKRHTMRAFVLCYALRVTKRLADKLLWFGEV